VASYASIEDYERRYGAVPADLRDRVEALIDDASALVADAVEGSTAPWVATGDDTPRIVVALVVGAARRAWSHTDGVVREQLGEFAVTYRADESWDIWLTKQERRIVRKAAGLGALTSVTLVSPYSGDDVPPSDLLLDGGGS